LKNSSPVHVTPSTTFNFESTSANTSLFEGTPHTTSQVGVTTSFTFQYQGMPSISTSIKGTQYVPNVVDIPNVLPTLPLRTPRVLHRKPKYFIDIYSNVLK
jgi:hypothetical protein